MQEWTPVKTDWEQDDVPPVGVFNRIEGNTLHLKETPVEDFELMGRSGVSHAFVSDWHWTLFKTIRRFPARSRLYIREASKVCEADINMDFELLIHSISDFPADGDLTWNTLPHFGGSYPPHDSKTRWRNNPLKNELTEHYYYGEPYDTLNINEGRGYLLLENSHEDPVTLVFEGRLATYSGETVEFSDRDMIYMRFHVGYMDVEE